MSSRASSSNDAGTVISTSCRSSASAGSRAANRASHARRRCRKYRADAATGESFGTSSGAPHGRIGIVRFARAYDSHDLADATRRDGFSDPRFRASSPTTIVAPSSSGQGSRRLSEGKSNSPETYKKDGSSERDAISPGFRSSPVITHRGASDQLRTPTSPRPSPSVTRHVEGTGPSAAS